MIAELNPEEIEDVLHSQFIARIGCHASGETYVVPVTYAYHEGYLYAHSAEGKKIKMMRENNAVCIEVDHMDNMANWQSVIAQGTYEELYGDEAREGMRRLIERIAPVIASESAPTGHDIINPMTHAENMLGLKAISFRIKLGKKSGRFERR